MGYISKTKQFWRDVGTIRREGKKQKKLKKQIAVRKRQVATIQKQQRGEKITWGESRQLYR